MEPTNQPFRKGKWSSKPPGMMFHVHLQGCIVYTFHICNVGKPMPVSAPFSGIWPLLWKISMLPHHVPWLENGESTQAAHGGNNSNLFMRGNWNRTIIIETYEIWNIPRKKKCETTNQYLASKEIYMQNSYYVQSSSHVLVIFMAKLTNRHRTWEWNSPISASRPQLGWTGHKSDHRQTQPWLRGRWNVAKTKR